jgi:mediator of RNA polymerase II transcription subunit 18
MHELFLTTQVANDDVQKALRILQGYCAMSPVNILRRRMTFEGPRTKNPKGIDPAFITKQPPPKVPQWRGLSEQLARQSYVLTLVYDVDRDQFGQDSSQSDVSDSVNTSQYVILHHSLSKALMGSLSVSSLGTVAL